MSWSGRPQDLSHAQLNGVLVQTPQLSIVKAPGQAGADPIGLLALQCCSAWSDIVCSESALVVLLSTPGDHVRKAWGQFLLPRRCRRARCLAHAPFARPCIPIASETFPKRTGAKRRFSIFFPEVSIGLALTCNVSTLTSVSCLMCCFACSLLLVWTMRAKHPWYQPCKASLSNAPLQP